MENGVINLAIRKYVQNEEFKKIVEDKLINATALKQVLKSKGILPICTTNANLAELVYRFFLGSEVMTKIREIMNFEQNNLKSTMLILNPTQQPEEFIDVVSDLLVKVQRVPNSKYKLKNISKKDSSISLQFAYNKFQKGRVELASEREVLLDVEISATNDDQYKVSVLHEGLSDSKQFFLLLEEISTRNIKEQPFTLKRISLSRLIKKNKVDFFDKFGKVKHKDWKVIDITNVTVNKDEKYIDEDDSMETELSENEATGKLTGISSAILTGDKLLNNDFVKECMDQGFIFSSMRYKFEHRIEPIVIQLDVSFKQTDLKINIIKTYIVEDDGKNHISTLPVYQQTEIINYFQSEAYKLYQDLLKTQENEEDNPTVRA